MPTSADVVAGHEHVYRRILKIWVNKTLPNPVQRLGFQPTKCDTNGISVYRERDIDAKSVGEAGANEKGYYVARLLVSEILSIDSGLSVIYDPQNQDLPGHCLVPKLTIGFHKKNEKQAKLIETELAKLAGQALVYETL